MGQLAPHGKGPTRQGRRHRLDGALLFSDEGAYITGQVISIDGGSTMRA